MRRWRKQEGASASIIIIAILFLALMAALGVVFYQNFVSPPKSVLKITKASSQTIKNQTAQVAFNSSIYALDYPNGWNGQTMTNGSASTITVKNSSGTIQVLLSISSNTVAEPCNPADGLQIHDYSVDNTSVTKLVSLPLYAVEAIFDAPGGGYQYTIGLVPDGGDTHASIGNSHCDVIQTGTAESAIMNGQAIVQPTIMATITFPKLPFPPKAAAADLQTLTSLTGSSDYKAALTILESARKE